MSKNTQNSLPQGDGAAAIKENKMGVMPVNKLLLTMAMPMVVSMLIQSLYNIVDSLYVSRISADQYEFTAISLAFAAQNFMIAVATGTGVGINALLSRSLGEKDFNKANRIASNGVFLALCSYLLFLVLGFTCIEPYMRLMTDNEAVIGFGVDYLFICYVLSFGVFGQIVFERLMLSTGKTHLSMMTQGFGALINIILDPIFIFTFDMGIKGAAIATVIGQVLASGLGIFLNQAYNREIKLSFKGFRPDGKLIGRIYAIGLPSVVMASIGSVMNVMLNSILNTFVQPIGDFAQKAFGAYYKLQSFIFMPIFGLNNGIVPIIAYNYGAGKRERMSKTIRLGIFYAVAYMLVGLVLFQTIPERLVSMFISSADAIEVGVTCLRVTSLSFVFAGFCIICGSVFQALGKSLFSMFVSIARQLVVLIPAAYLLSLSGNVGNVWWSFPIAEVMSLIISALFLAIIYKNIISKVGFQNTHAEKID